MRDDTRVISRRLFACFLSVLALGLLSVGAAQEVWKATTDLPGVDWQGLAGAKRTAALNAMRAEGCACGCGMKVAECRVNDPSCGVSKKLASAAVKAASEGKNVDSIRADLKRVASEPPPLFDDPVKIPVDGAPSRGPANARVVIVEYSDFQCPYCSKAVKQVEALQARFPKDIRLVFKQFPLDQHAQAETASEAALAAHNQGKFWQLHDKMYSDISDLSKERLLVYAKQIGLDTEKFRKDLESRKYEKEVARQRDEGEHFGVDSTPTFFVNGKKYNGAFEVNQLAPLIEKELK